MLSFTTAKWVAVYTQSRAEKQVLARLEQQGFETYLPIIEIKRHWSDRIKMVKTPLFSSYLFVKIKKNEPILVRKTPGVVYIVAFHNEITTIPEQEIENIRQFIAQKQEIFVEQTQRLKKGSTVRIVEGPFSGMVGTLIDDNKRGNFAVKIDALGVSLVTQIDRLMLEVANEPKATRRKKYNL